ncbi:protein of unknown function [Burkholderia multivorans]
MAYVVMQNARVEARSNVVITKIFFIL